MNQHNTRDAIVAAKIEALANADAHLTDAGMPGASEMILALRAAWQYIDHPGRYRAPTWSAAHKAVKACLDQLTTAHDDDRLRQWENDRGEPR